MKIELQFFFTLPGTKIPKLIILCVYISKKVGSMFVYYSYVLNDFYYKTLLQAFIPLLKKAADANKTKPFGVNRAAIIYMSSIMGSVGTEIDFDSQYWGYRESKVGTEYL